VHVDRLLGFPAAARDYIWAEIDGYASGGAGYLLSYQACQRLLVTLLRHGPAPEDVMVGQAAQAQGVAFHADLRFRPWSRPGEYPTPDNFIVTGHHVSPEAMEKIHAGLTSRLEPVRTPGADVFTVEEWVTGWGLLGLSGALGFEVDGTTRVELPALPLEWEHYELVSGHVDCHLTVTIHRPAALFGFLDGRSWDMPDSPVDFVVDGRTIGTVHSPGGRTQEILLSAGTHVISMTTPGRRTRRYPVWAVRRFDPGGIRIAMPTSNGHVEVVPTTLTLLDRYWPVHPSVDIIRHENPVTTEAAQQFFAGAQGVVSWCQALARYLEAQNHDELLLLLLDDYGLCGPVDRALFEMAQGLMLTDLSIGAFYLTWMMTPSGQPYAGRTDVVVLPRWEYSVHTQAGLWRRESLLRMLRRLGHASIDAFELQGSRLYNDYEADWERHVSFNLPEPPVPSLFLDSCDKTFWPVPYHNLVRRGRPDERHAAFLRAEGLSHLTLTRGRTTNAEPMALPTGDRSAWFARGGDETLRLDYPLTPDSVVVDLGMYHGCWTAAIFERYGCSVHGFEPVSEFYRRCQERFVDCDRVRVSNLAVGARSGTVRVGVGGDASGLFHVGAPAFETVTIVPIAQVLNELAMIDLIKINVEGAEYEILESILDLRLQDRLADIQVQFHSVVPEAEARREAIRRRLGETHQLTYDFPFVWENWRRPASG
jgi:FkbM family methyltransferase